jgi:hypothetical protein
MLRQCRSPDTDGLLSALIVMPPGVRLPSFFCLLLLRSFRLFAVMFVLLNIDHLRGGRIPCNIRRPLRPFRLHRHDRLYGGIKDTDPSVQLWMLAGGADVGAYSWDQLLSNTTLGANVNTVIYNRSVLAQCLSRGSKGAIMATQLLIAGARADTKNVPRRMCEESVLEAGSSSPMEQLLKAGIHHASAIQRWYMSRRDDAAIE